MGRFIFDGEHADEIVMIAGGVGITPLMSKIRFLVAQKWAGKIDLIYSVKNRRDIIFAQELAELTAEFPALRVHVTLTSDDEAWTGARGRLSAEFAGATRQKVKRLLLDRLDEAHRFEAPPSLVEEEFKLMWTSIKAEMESNGKTFADEDTTEEAAESEYRTIADRRVRLGLVLSEIGEKNKITVTEDEVGRAVIERARQMPGREKEVWDYYRNNANALAQLRAPIYEDKVVDFILELATVTEKKVTREELYKDEDEVEKSAA